MLILMYMGRRPFIRNKVTKLPREREGEKERERERERVAHLEH